MWKFSCLDLLMSVVLRPILKAKRQIVLRVSGKTDNKNFHVIPGNLTPHESPRSDLNQTMGILEMNSILILFSAGLGHQVWPKQTRTVGSCKGRDSFSMTAFPKSFTYMGILLKQWDVPIQEFRHTIQSMNYEEQPLMSNSIMKSSKTVT